LALEDAFDLGRSLRDVADPETAFALFERHRRDRADRVLAMSRRIGKQKAPSGWIGRKIRDLILPFFLRKGAHAAEWMYAYRFDWSEPMR
jgi:2-polyprenyl-6-methoxyphenol hydroxylase-like FAD-dependent oxidoreductase